MAPAPISPPAQVAAAEGERDQAIVERDAAIKVCEMTAMSGGFYARHAENAQRRAEIAEAQLSAALARAERLEEALAWYVANDDVNLCDPENSFWIDGYNRARSALTQPTPAADPGDAADAGR